MKTTAILAAVIAASLATPAALACPADTSLEDGPAAETAAPVMPAEGEPLPVCAVRIPGNPKMAGPRSRMVSCRRSFARKPAPRHDAA